VPLGYSFRLYTYGPYDSQILEDLKIAEGRGAILCRKFDWQGGTGYEIKAGHPIMTENLLPMLNHCCQTILTRSIGSCANSVLAPQAIWSCERNYLCRSRGPSQVNVVASGIS
jgi:hypothetical protein